MSARRENGVEPPRAPETLEEQIKAEARRLGLDLVGIAGAGPFTAEAAVLAERGALGYRSPLEEADVSLRTEPERLLPGVRSIIAVGLNYYQPDGIPAGSGLRGWLSRYARGRVDYHRLLRDRLQVLGEYLQCRVPGARVLVHVDTGPPLDRAVAVRAGLGWYGRHAQLITRGYASWVFLGELLTDAVFVPDKPVTGTCGTCRRCIDACPTGAIVAPGVVDASRCLSAVTQQKGYLPRELRRAMGTRIFGCDDCLDACPHNVHARPVALLELAVNPEVGGYPELSSLLTMTRGQFKRWFAAGAAGWRGKTVLQRNAVIALGNSADQRALPLLLAALTDARPVLRGHAAWALAELVRRGAAEVGEVAAVLTAVAASESDAAVGGELRQALRALQEKPAGLGQEFPSGSANQGETGG